MPFTLAHPVVVIPLRRHADLTALVIGSMVPDLTHFTGLDIDRGITHHLLLWPLFSLPVGLLVYLLFTRGLREPLMSLAPLGLVERLTPRERQTIAPDHWKLVLLGLAVGAASHLLFDRLTTLNPAYDWTLPLLAPMVSVAGIPVSVQDLLRHGSAVLGLGLIAFWTLRWWRFAAHRRLDAEDLGPLHLQSAARLLIVAIGAIVVLVASLLAALAEDGISTRHLIGNTVRYAMPGSTLAVIAYAVAWHGWRHARRARLAER